MVATGSDRSRDSNAGAPTWTAVDLQSLVVVRQLRSATGSAQVKVERSPNGMEFQEAVGRSSHSGKGEMV